MFCKFYLDYVKDCKLLKHYYFVLSCFIQTYIIIEDLFIYMHDPLEENRNFPNFVVHSATNYNITPHAMHWTLPQSNFMSFPSIVYSDFISTLGVLGWGRGKRRDLMPWLPNLRYIKIHSDSNNMVVIKQCIRTFISGSHCA